MAFLVNCYIWKNTFIAFLLTFLLTLIQSVQINDIVVIRLVAEEEPNLPTTKSQFKKMTYCRNI